MALKIMVNVGLGNGLLLAITQTNADLPGANQTIKNKLHYNLLSDIKKIRYQLWDMNK